MNDVDGLSGNNWDSQLNQQTMLVRLVEFALTCPSSRLKPCAKLASCTIACTCGSIVLRQTEPSNSPEASCPKRRSGYNVGGAQAVPANVPSRVSGIASQNRVAPVAAMAAMVAKAAL